MSSLALLEMKVVDTHDRKHLAYRSNPTVPGLSSWENSTSRRKLRRVRPRFDECSGVHVQALIVRTERDWRPRANPTTARLAQYVVIRNPRITVGAKEVFPCGLEDSERDVVRRTDGDLPGSISNRLSKLGESRKLEIPSHHESCIETDLRPSRSATHPHWAQLSASTGVETPQCFGSRTDAQVRA